MHGHDVRAVSRKTRTVATKANHDVRYSDGRRSKPNRIREGGQREGASGEGTTYRALASGTKVSTHLFFSR
jgi:hypothetical protein